VPEPRRDRRAVGLERNDENSRCLVEPMESCHAAQERHVLTGDAKVTASNPSITEERRKNRDDGADRHREAESLPSRNDCRVYPAERTITCDQRSTGIAWIERGIRLDDLINQSPRTRPKRAAERADHTGGDGVMEAVGIPDRNDELPRAKRPRVAEGYRHEIG